jgi:N6-L-threonylcarbamoyladenine synthase
MALPYPGGPVIDKLAKEGNSDFLQFNKPKIEGLDFSFSGLKTSFLYTLQKEVKKDPDFVEKNSKDICASIQKTIVDILIEKVTKAAKSHNIKEIALAGGVSANSELRSRLLEAAKENQWNAYIPPFEYTTDNAAMIGITGYYQYLKENFAKNTVTAKARVSI